MTHFSSRYVKIAEILPEHTDSKVMIAFDHLRLFLRDFEWAYKYLPIYGAVISNDKEENENEDQESGHEKDKNDKK